MLGIVLTEPRSPINRENFHKIEIGMTADQVQTIFGVPPGVYGVGLAQVPPLDEAFGDEKAMIWEAENLGRMENLMPVGTWWASDTGFAVVKFDQDGRGEDMAYTDLRAESLRARVRRWLGL